jgi:DNA-binding beta-propeller fold protein YncE
VFIANPDNDSVTRVNVDTLEVRTTPVGREPSAVAITPDWSPAVVFNQGDATVSVIDADTLDTTQIAVRPNLNHLVLSPDGRWLYSTNNKGGTVSKVDTTGTSASLGAHVKCAASTRSDSTPV